ncbi:MAG: DUF554 domain-containing protein [Bacteroidaceae bacterium]|nr:DUF554 domain-containing protein [Bacteroidaceae bacterium]MBQ3957777.1 DUF554 domain-containing protein [Bacteroidaceae bacterium]
MIGTITNTLAILVGTAVGGTLRRGIKPQYQEAMFTAIGLASLALGFNAVCRHMPQSHYPVLFVLSLVVGGLVGRMLNLDGRVKRSTQQATEGSDFPLMQGLTTAVLLFCIGTLSIVGPINSALLGDHTYLFTNAMLDLVTSAILSATYGYGIALAAPVLFCWQGSIYLLARLCGNIIPDELLCEISIVGGTLIAASGLGILRIKDCRTLDLLPSLLVPVIYFLIKGILLTA